MIQTYDAGHHRCGRPGCVHCRFVREQSGERPKTARARAFCEGYCHAAGMAGDPLPGLKELAEVLLAAGYRGPKGGSWGKATLSKLLGSCRRSWWEEGRAKYLGKPLG